jgi:hypothetical protein
VIWPDGDLAALTAADILAAHGAGRGRYYVAGPILREIGERRRSARQPIRDPYPWMRPRLAERTEQDVTRM